jgi:two-component system NtrC family sensor kinase
MNDVNPTKRMSLRLRVAVGAFVLLVLGLGAALLSSAAGEHELIEESAKEDYTDYVRCLAVMVQEDMAKGDDVRVAGHVSAAFRAAGGNIKYVVVEDPSGAARASAGAPEPGGPVDVARVTEVGPHPGSFFHEEGHTFEIAAPLWTDGKRLGAVRIGLSTRKMNQGVLAHLRSAVLPTALGVALFAVLAFYVDSRLRGALRRFIAATRRMADGHLERHVEIRTGDDLEELARNFNRMADSLRGREDELRQSKASLETTVRERTAELSAQKDRLDAIVDAVGAGMLLLDADMRVLWANRAAQEWFAGERPIVGSSCPWLDGGRTSACGKCPSRTAARSRRTEVADCVAVDVHGERRYFTVVSSPVRSADGRSTEVLELLIDVTRSKQVEADLLQAAKLASVGELAGGVAHEIGNPLAIVSAKTKLLLAALREGRTPEHLVQDLEKIERQTERIGRIAGGLLTFSRRAPGDRALMRVDDALREGLSFLDHLFAGSRVRIALDAPADLPEVLACREEIVQVVVNVVQNALDAMPDGGELRIAASAKDDGVELSFSDTGPGMPESVRRRVFDTFFTTKSAGRGTGLGLSISHRIVRDHDGRLSVESGPGGGSTFRLWLPAAMERAHA